MTSLLSGKLTSLRNRSEPWKTIIKIINKHNDMIIEYGRLQQYIGYALTQGEDMTSPNVLPYYLL
jgi:hypothetical protein